MTLGESSASSDRPAAQVQLKPPHSRMATTTYKPFALFGSSFLAVTPPPLTDNPGPLCLLHPLCLSACFHPVRLFISLLVLENPTATCDISRSFVASSSELGDTTLHPSLSLTVPPPFSPPYPNNIYVLRYVTVLFCSFALLPIKLHPTSQFPSLFFTCTFLWRPQSALKGCCQHLQASVITKPKCI